MLDDKPGSYWNGQNFKVEFKQERPWMLKSAPSGLFSNPSDAVAFVVASD